jgi:hypothetical protein
MPTKKHPPAPPEPEEASSQDDSIEEEDTGTGSAAVKPWDPKKIRIATKTFSLREVVDQINENEIDLAPDFQRDYVWKQRQRTRLVESILLNIPLPAFYFNQERDGTYQVVDGIQRLSTIQRFMADRHILEEDDLEYLRDLKGLTYSTMDPAMVRRFRGTQIVVHVIEPQTPDEVKYDIFGRVNTLGSPLSAQEIRHAMSKARSRDFLKRLVELESFEKATGGQFWRRSPDSPDEWVRDSNRMTDRELALRFCAFFSFSEEEYRRHESLDAFLVDYTRRLDGRSTEGTTISDKEIESLAAAFDRAMTNASQVLEKAAFRRWPPGVNRRGPINRAVFESQAVALAAYSLDQLLPKKDEVLKAFREAFSDPDYARAVTVGTGDPTTITRRLKYTRETLAKVIG